MENRVFAPNRNLDRTRSKRVRSVQVGHFMASGFFGSGTESRVDFGFSGVNTHNRWDIKVLTARNLEILWAKNLVGQI